MSLQETSINNIIKDGYSDIKKHIFKEELTLYRNIIDTLTLNPTDLNNMKGCLDIIIKINYQISHKLLNMLPGKGDLAKFDAFLEFISLNPAEGAGKLKYSFDFELFKKSTDNINLDKFYNSVDKVSNQAEKILDLQISSKKKDLTDSDVEVDKQEQIRQLKFKIHVADFLRYKLAGYWGIKIDIDEEVLKFEYNDVEKTKVDFVSRLIDQTVKTEIVEYQEILRVMNQNIVCRLCCLTKLLEVNSALLQDILVNWKLKEDRSGMFGY
tara:strand:+ start:3205 stop:4008 length:804 start_codon:yes stop_codon:yes gene_type:complete